MNIWKLNCFKKVWNLRSTRKLLKDAVFTDDVDGRDAMDVKVSILWDTWSLKQKLVWFFMNKLGFGHDEIERFKEMLRFLEQSDLYNLQEEPYDAKEFKDKFEKYWYTVHPQTIMLCSYKFYLPYPTEYVKCSVVVAKESSNEN